MGDILFENDNIEIGNFDYSIGVDFSIASTAMCVKKLDKYYFYWFPKVEATQKIPKFWDEIKEFAQVVPYLSKKDKANYTTHSINHVNNALLLSDLILDCLYDVDKSVPINIEGFSYGSEGQSYIDLITYQSIFRGAIINSERVFNVYSPRNIKKDFSGNGTSVKEDMCRVLTHLEYDCENVKKLQSLIEGNIKDRSNIKKPIDDLVDALAICNMNNPNKISVDRLWRDKTKIEVAKINKKAQTNVDDFLNNLYK